MRLSPAVGSMLAAPLALLLLNMSANAEDMPNPAKMPVPKAAAPQPAPPVLPQGQNVQILLKYKGEPMAEGDVSKPTRPAPIVAPSKF
jgi:hypothetical protein